MTAQAVDTWQVAVLATLAVGDAAGAAACRIPRGHVLDHRRCAQGAWYNQASG